MAIMVVRKILKLFRLLLNGNREQAITVKGFQNKSNIKFHCQVLSWEDLTLPCCRHVGPPPRPGRSSLMACKKSETLPAFNTEVQGNLQFVYGNHNSKRCFMQPNIGLWSATFFRNENHFPETKTVGVMGKHERQESKCLSLLFTNKREIRRKGHN